MGRPREKRDEDIAKWQKSEKLKVGGHVHAVLRLVAYSSRNEFTSHEIDSAKTITGVRGLRSLRALRQSGIVDYEYDKKRKVYIVSTPKSVLLERLEKITRPE